MVNEEKDKVTDGGETVFRITASQALSVAEMQIEKCRRLKEWRDAYAVRAFPLFSRLDKEEPSYFEVKISTPSDDDAGTVIISATDKDFPIIGFRTRGRTLTEKAISKSGHEVKRIIWHGLNAVTGEDEAGKEIISLGCKPTLVFDLKEYEEVRRKRKEKLLPKPLPEPKESEELQEEWKEVKKALGLIKSNPWGVTADSFSFAWGWTRHANLDQYELSNGEQVGCGPTAWSALLVYHDMYWDPDFLYGTHDYMSDYIKRSMKKFHDRMDTDDGSTKAWNMKDGFDVFKDFHCFGNLSFDPDDYTEWDWDVCVLGTEPGEAIQNLILSRIAADTPVIVGLVTDTSWIGYETKGHYCLGLAWAKNDKGKLKWVLCDELHGEELDDLWWWHRKAIFGAWGIPRGRYDRARQATEIDVWSDIDLANFGDEIYGVGRKRPLEYENPVFLVRRGPASGFPIPEKGTNAKRLEFDKSIEVPVYELQGSEVYPCNPSITAWNHKVTSLVYLDATKLFPADFRAKGVDFTRESFANTLLQPKIQHSQTFVKDIKIDLPYIFLAWADLNGRIHVAYAIITENLEDMSFTHVLLPERFRNYRYDQTPIAIAQDDRTGPMLYIGYTDANHYLISDEVVFAGLGRLVIINLDLFFQIAETGEDLWPQDTLPNLTYTPETVEVPVMPGSDATFEIQQDVLTDFKWHWPRLVYHPRNLRLSSNGKQVALLWENGGRLWIHWSYTFESIWPTGVFVTFGGCILRIAYAKHGERFLHHSRYKETEGDYWLGDVQAIDSDVFYGSDSKTLLVWSDPDGRVLISEVRKSPPNHPRRAVLLADFFRTGSNPKLAFVKDKLDNRNIVAFSSHWYEGHLWIRSRILYFSGAYVPGITDFDDLPK